jgi:Holliday junction resolvase-like predicted endonuclease
MKESLIQKKIKETHERDGWIVIKLIQTTLNGVPDLMMMKAGQVVFVEVKTGKNKSTPLQQYVQNKIREKGITVFETSNPDFHL